MAGKFANPTINWQSTNPAPFKLNTPLSGNTTGAMASTNTIYTNIIDAQNYDNVGFEVTWTGTPTGTITVMGSNGGTNFYSLTFDPLLAQPAGSAGGYLISLAAYPFRFYYIEYVNSTGTGTLAVFASEKAV